MKKISTTFQQQKKITGQRLSCRDATVP